jgi:regulator of sigma E protease
MLSLFVTLVLVALSLYLTIFVHEWFHYLAAKRRGIHTEGLNIGIGPLILQHKGKKLDFNIRLMPVGGYLEIPDMAFFKPTNLAPRDRCFIALAGPVGNLALCLYLAVMLSVLGIPSYQNSLTVGYVREDAGLQIKPGDKIETINGTKPSNWGGVLRAIYYHQSTNCVIVVSRGTQLITNNVPILLPKLITPIIQLSPAQHLINSPDPLIHQDLLTVNGSPYYDADTFMVAKATNQPVVVVYRENQQLHTNTWPVNEALLHSLWELDPPVAHIDPLTILGGTTWQLLKSMSEIFNPHSNLNMLNLSGPLTTMLFLQRYFDTDIRLGIFLMLALNLNLILFNLLPIYPMDGSHVMVALLEKTRWLKPFKTLMYFVTWFVLFLLAWMLFVDVIKYSVL